MAAAALLLLAILCLTSRLSTVAAAVAECGAKNTSLAGYRADLRMSQHQLRGRVEVLDGCSFRVAALDLLPGSTSARWWRAEGTDLDALARGEPAASDPLDRTFRSESLVFRLLPGLSWPLVPVLAAYDPLTSSLFGFVRLSDANASSDPSSSASSAPTMLDSCAQLSPRFRVRWTLHEANNSVDIGLEAAAGSEYYMAFGWAEPGVADPSVIGADLVVAGFTEDGLPFADDYYVTKNSECLLREDGSVEGVCPDTIYGGRNDSARIVNDTRLVYGHRRDGVSFVRFSRTLVSADNMYDVPVNATRNMTVAWAIGLLRPPDSLRPYYLPLMSRGASAGTAFAFAKLNLSDASNGCVGPLDADDKEDQARITAERKTPLIVTVGPALHYPNPPNPDKVLYINKKEAPLLKVERGVPVTFSIEAGHDVPLYITSDPVGGNATSRNTPEVIYAGGPKAEGVPATPTELVWLPDRNTPDLVYYQSLYDPKMGWKIQVVDGGLSDMYNNSVLLDDQQVTFFWTLSGDSINIAARGEKKSGYLAVGFGSAMVNSYAYVGWVDGNGKGHVKSYWIDGKDGMTVHETHENITHKRCRSENGVIIFEFTRPLTPSCSGRVECKNIIDPTTPLKVIWAMGAQWSSGPLSLKNMHSDTSNRPIRILLLSGLAEAVEDLRPVLAVHGFMMFVAWAVFLPGGIMAVRYLKHLKGDLWFQAHTYLQYSSIAVMLLGVLFAVAELRGFSFKSRHARIGAVAFTFACVQPINAYLRPHKTENRESSSGNRIIWEYLHIFTGRSAALAGIVALFTGLQHLGHRYGSKNIKGLTCGLILWFLSVALMVAYFEYMAFKRRRDGADGLSGKWVLGNAEEDDTVDLLQSDRVVSKVESNSSPGPKEVQLEPLKG
ncbi:Cytochrome b561, DM13 and DOMON domain-containing protein [Dichanthelium oligosanthes]|uniref:Cytochrome b561, DM13 and DOMON domain-containing protein n=1 Tax=Dichanthelium oligosanthes TaxID=888268 RepID=A0A1E5VRT8_9POAL|nr:Cytochrome b561, DM13 and DOMON domain-containing protein [Dichanthelium oligosanthes]